MTEENFNSLSPVPMISPHAEEESAMPLCTSVHPKFDATTRTWFVDGLSVETKTLAAMQVKLGPGVTIVGYDPRGYTEKIVTSGNPRASFFTLPRRAIPTQTRADTRRNIVPPHMKMDPAPLSDGAHMPRASGRLSGAGRRRTMDWDAVANLYHAGNLNMEEIANELGGTFSAVASAIKKMRERGDGRVLSRLGRKVKSHFWTAEEEAKLLGLRKTLSPYQMAIEMNIKGVSRSAIIGKLFRMDAAEREGRQVGVAGTKEELLRDGVGGNP